MRTHLIFTLLTVLCAASVRGETGRAGAILFQQPFGARPFALGQAYSALGDDVFGLSYNPAILSRLPDSQVATQFVQSVTSAKLGYVGFATPLNPANALGVSVGYLDTGAADIFDASGSRVGQVTIERDFLLQLGYARSFMLGAGRLHLGASPKIMRSVLVNEVTATAYAADVGALYERPLGPGRASLAVVMANMGPGIRYSGGIASGSQTDPLPLTSKIAASYTRPAFLSDSIALGITIDRVFPDDEIHAGLGGEYVYHGICALRAGYRFAQDTGGLTFGTGVKFSKIALDYSFGLVQSLSHIHHISLTYHFTIPGIEYTAAAAAAVTPMESLSKDVREAIAHRRWFEAMDSISKLEGFFPGSASIAQLRQDIFASVHRRQQEATLDAPDPYAAAFLRWQDGAWEDVVRFLSAAKAAEPGNDEIRRYLERARRRLTDIKERKKLEEQARYATLFELASQAYEAEDLNRARRILQELLSIGSYQPARSLLHKIEIAQRTRPSIRPPVVAAPVAPTTNPAKAEALYYEALRQYAGNEPERALSSLTEALKLDPANPNVRNTLDRLQRELRAEKP